MINFQASSSLTKRISIACSARSPPRPPIRSHRKLRHRYIDLPATALCVKYDPARKVIFPARIDENIDLALTVADASQRRRVRSDRCVYAGCLDLKRFEVTESAREFPLTITADRIGTEPASDRSPALKVANSRTLPKPAKRVDPKWSNALP